MFPVVFLLLIACQGILRRCSSENSRCDISSFPTWFKFGAGSSAYQIEGAWNEDGKGRSWWDWFSTIFPIDHGDVACDSYHKYKEDVAAMKQIGLDYYRFSLSWSRILPKGFANEINQAGVDYYNRLLDELEAAGIEPLVTIYHFDIPLAFKHIGDWTSPKMIDYFVAYAHLAFKLFGNRVKYWVTINEPRTFCLLMTSILKINAFPELPAGTAEYLCAHHMLLAHAHTYRLYENIYRQSQKGKLGIALDFGYNMPLTGSAADLEAVERAYAFDIRWLTDPLIFGDYPQLMQNIVAENSASQSLFTSRLPTFSAAEKKLLKGTYDVLMFNTFTSYMVTNAPYDSTPSYLNDRQVVNSYAADWPVTNVGLAVHPAGIRGLLQYVKETFGNTEIFVTNNGYSDAGGLNDKDRIEFIQATLQQIRLAMCEDGVNISRYTYWSILDSYEWSDGYKAKFGLVQVDFDNPNLTRTLKDSASYYRDVIQTRLIHP